MIRCALPVFPPHASVDATRTVGSFNVVKPHRAMNWHNLYLESWIVPSDSKLSRSSSVWPSQRNSGRAETHDRLSVGSNYAGPPKRLSRHRTGVRRILPPTYFRSEGCP